MRTRFCLLLLALASVGCATVYPAPGVDRPVVDSTPPGAFSTTCKTIWSGTSRDHAQALEDAVIHTLDVETANGEHYTPPMACNNMQGFHVTVLPLSKTKLDTNTGRHYFPPPVPPSQLPAGEQKLTEAYGFTDCAAHTVTLADDDWSNGAGATELLHTVDRCAGSYAIWKTNGFRAAINDVMLKFKVPR